MIIQSLRSGREQEILRLHEVSAYLSQLNRIKPAFDYLFCVLELCYSNEGLLGWQPVSEFHCQALIKIIR